MNRARAWLRLKMGWIPRPVRRAIVSVIGGTLLLMALAGMVLPIVPGVIFLPFGLAILAIEFAWAARWLKRLRKTANNVHSRMRGGAARGGAQVVELTSQPAPSPTPPSAVLPVAADCRNAAA
jgi:hypothetical protein